MRKIISSFRRRPESSNMKTLQSKARSAFGSLREDYLIDWIPACAGMTAQRGFSIITAIFLLVVLSFLGIAMVSFSTSQHQSSAMDVMGSRAYQAARAGVEWANYHVEAASSSAAWDGCAASQPVAVAGTLAPFSPVNVDCTVASYSTVWIYDVTSTAKTSGNPGDQNFVKRVISVKLLGRK